MFRVSYGIDMYFSDLFCNLKAVFARSQVYSSWMLHIFPNCNPADDGLIRDETF